MAKDRAARTRATSTAGNGSASNGSGRNGSANGSGDQRNGKSRPTPAQRAWLERGLEQAGGKLPLFDDTGQRVNALTIRSCIDQGWAEPWFANPLKPDWLVCKLTEAGRSALGRSAEDTL